VSKEQHRQLSPRVLGFAILTASDSRGAADDTSGDRIDVLATQAGHAVRARELVKDDAEAIRDAVVRLLAAPGVDAVVVTGGTGFSPRDVSVEAVAPLFDRPVEGFGELFRMLSYQQVGAAAMLSRATAGLVGERAVFLLPGSPQAVALAMEALILPEAAHLLGQARRGP
jgi:molybdenum cofactor biosynthesis protein B